MAEQPSPAQLLPASDLCLGRHCQQCTSCASTCHDACGNGRQRAHRTQAAPCWAELRAAVPPMHEACMLRCARKLRVRMPAHQWLHPQSGRQAGRLA